MVLGRGSTWVIIPCDEWSYEGSGGEGHRTFQAGEVATPDAEGWARLAGALSAAAPLSQAAVGPVLSGPAPGIGERLPGMILVALDQNPDPLETAYHEVMHEVWNKLDPFSEQLALAAHADAVRAAYKAQGLDTAHLVGDEEATAVTFSRWAIGHPDTVSPGPDVLAIWQAIKCGDVAIRITSGSGRGAA